MTGFGCILAEDNDVEAQIARMCDAVLWLGCACESACECGGALSCVRDKHPQGELHRDIDGIEWRQVDHV